MGFFSSSHLLKLDSGQPGRSCELMDSSLGNHGYFVFGQCTDYSSSLAQDYWVRFRFVQLHGTVRYKHVRLTGYV